MNLLQCEGFPLGGEGGVSDEVGERVTTSGLVGWEWVRGDGMVDKGGKGGGEVVRRDVGCMEVVRVVGWDMSSMYSGGHVVGNMSGMEGSGGGGSRSVPWEGGGEVSGMG